MDKILVISDFSDSAQNATDFACSMCTEISCDVIVVNIFDIPYSYAADGVSLISLDDDIKRDNERLHDEISRLKAKFPSINITGKSEVGAFLESLNEINMEICPDLIIIGAMGNYSEILNWDDNWLDAIVEVNCPVLVIPSNIKYITFNNIALAHDYIKACSPKQVQFMIKITRFFNAKFHVVHVEPSRKHESHTNIISEIKSELMELYPSYTIVQEQTVLRGVSDFVRKHQVDLLIVLPHKHGFWHKILNESYTKQLAQLNNIPVLALHD